jgi:hypothetical protein
MRKEQKKISLLTDGPAMEGRYISADGVDHGDADFHLTAMNGTPENERADLKEITQQEAPLAISQVERLCEDEDEGIRALQHLIALFPNHPERTKWETRVNNLQQKKSPTN